MENFTRGFIKPRHTAIKPQRRCLLFTLATVLLALLGLTMTRQAANAQSAEYTVKSAFIYNFAKYVDWPGKAFSGKDSPFVVGIVGTDPFGDSIDNVLKGKSINGHPFSVKRLSFGAGMKDCHLVFLAASEDGKAGQLAGVLKGAPVLTVGDSAGFASKGGMFSFFLDGSKVRFEINPGAAGKAGLTVNDKLLGLAKVVK